MVLLIDLDGTLTDTAHARFKRYKDGLEDFVLQDIPVFPGALDFVKKQIEENNTVVVVSDSNPKYVSRIATEIFKVQSINLADKPNVVKVNDFINNNQNLSTLFLNSKSDFLVIGDSWLDIELGRRLRVPTVLTSFYKPSDLEERDGIGQEWKPIKMGPTFYARNFPALESIVGEFNSNLLAIESIFQNSSSANAVHFKDYKDSIGRILFRCLARQEDGECDAFAKASVYYQIDNPNRSKELLSNLAKGVANYLKAVVGFKALNWDLFTYVSDKKTTTPPNKMWEIFELVETDIPKQKILQWSDNVTGSLRHHPDYASRKEFIHKYIHISADVDLTGKNIIVLDDQFTSSATAQVISKKLRASGAKNVLFIALFYLVLPVNNRQCPRCGKPLLIKIRKVDGNKFYSCLSPQFRGQGCGYTENIH